MNDFDKWLDNALIGDRIEYYSGFLCVDVDKLKSAGRADDHMREKAAALDGLREDALRAAKRGDVALVQKRLGHMDFSYQAVRI